MTTPAAMPDPVTRTPHSHLRTPQSNTIVSTSSGATKRRSAATPSTRRSSCIRLQGCYGSRPMTTVVLLGTLDTKGAEYDFVRRRLLDLGTQVVVIDAGTMGQARYAVGVGAAGV